MAPICFDCCVEMVCHKNGQAFTTGAGLFHGDVFRCPTCDFMVITGFGREPMTQEWQPDYQATLAYEEAHGGIIAVVEPV